MDKQHAPTQGDSSAGKGGGLDRRIGLGLLLLYGLGNILGAGIYVLVGKVAGEAGYGTPLAFLLASVAAGFTVFSYAELSARYPVSAGEAVYLFEGFRKRGLSILVGVLLALSGIASAATISRGFAGYLQAFWVLPESFLIVVFILSLGLIALWGIAESLKFAALLTLAEILGLLMIVWVGSDSLTGQVVIDLSQIELKEVLSPGIFLGAFLAFYAFIGFEDMVNIAEEVESPQRNLPLAAVLALAVATLLYCAISWIAVSVVSPVELSASDAPLALVYERASGQSSTIISVIGLLAIVNGALIQIIMGSRIIYGMACRGWMPAVFSQVHPGTKTPMYASVLVIVMLLVFALSMPLLNLAELTSFLVLSVFFMVNAALIKVKALYPNPSGVRVFPVWLPWCGLVISAAFIALKLILE